VVGQEQAPDLLGAPERSLHLGRIREPVACGHPDHDDDLDEERGRRDHRADPHPRGAAREPDALAAIAEVCDHEQEHDHHRAGVDEYLRGGEELGRGEQEQHGEGAQVRDQGQRRIEGVREGDHGEAGAEAAPRSQEPDHPDEEVGHA
jgi:hypothetical protein